MSMIIEQQEKYLQSPPGSNKFLPEWSTVISCCKTYEIFPRLNLCFYINKIINIIFQRPMNPEMNTIFDDCLSFAFILMFIGFLFTSIYTIFVEDRKSLKELRMKVKRSTDAIVGILRAFWILKEVKIQNVQLVEESKKMLKLMKNNINNNDNNDDTNNTIMNLNKIDDSTHEYNDECAKTDIIKCINTEDDIIIGSEGDFVLPSKIITIKHLPLPNKIINNNNNNNNRRINRYERNLQPERHVTSEKNLSYGGNHYNKSNTESSAPTTPRKTFNNNTASAGGGIFNNRKFRDGRI